jgi:antitoxin HicB
VLWLYLLPCPGSSFDNWLCEDGLYEEVTAGAIKRVLARQVEAAMKRGICRRQKWAQRVQTSLVALAQLLDPDYDAVTLSA